MFYKKGQIEIVGLVVIIVLLAVLAIIFLWFYTRVGTDSLTSELRGAYQGTNMLLALMETTTTSGVLFEDLVENCAQGVCHELEQESKIILNLAFLKKKFTFSIFKAKDTEAVFILVENTCKNGLVSDSMLRKNGVNYKLVLKIC